MSGTNSKELEKASTSVYALYGLLRDLLSAYFSGPLSYESERIKQTYALLVSSINTALYTPGLEELRDDCYFPFKTLPAPAEITSAEWDGLYSAEVDKAYSVIKSYYLAAGSPPLDELDEIEELVDDVKKTIKKYRKEKGKLAKKRSGELKKAAIETPTEVESLAASGGVINTARAITDGNAGTSLIKKIIIGVIIGVIATVIGRLIVYFLVGG
jgi:hypothetical protein